MKRVELYGRVRHAVMIEGLSQREAARCFGIDPRTVRKMLSYSVPPGMSGRGLRSARSSIRSSVLSTVSWKRIRIVRRSNLAYPVITHTHYM